MLYIYIITFYGSRVGLQWLYFFLEEYFAADTILLKKDLFIYYSYLGGGHSGSALLHLGFF